jgi:hypothetical protein
MRIEPLGFMKESYLIADKDVHEWSGYDSIGIPTVIIWTISFVLLRYWVFA